jgi:hypothetical protein
LQTTLRKSLTDAQQAENASAVRNWHGRYDPPQYAQK